MIVRFGSVGRGEAEELLPAAFEIRVLQLGDEHPVTQESLNNLIELYTAWGKPKRIEDVELRVSN